MKKLSEILALGIENFNSRIQRFPGSRSETYPAMCNCINHIKEQKIINLKEQSLFTDWIENILGNRAYLSNYLKDQQLPFFPQDRLNWYKEQQAKLEAEGN